MAPLPIVAKIGEASKDAWPRVSEALDVTMRSAYEIAEISEAVVPRVEEYVAKGKTGSLRRRKVCEETVWVLSQLGWLRTGPERDVILAAKAFADVAADDDASDDEYDAACETLLEQIKLMPDYLTHPANPVTQEA